MPGAAILPRVVGAPMAGGPSTPELVAAVSRAGGLGMVAAGYRSAAAVEEELDRVEALLPQGAPYGVNLFAAVEGPADPADVAAYGSQLADRAAHAGVALGTPRFDDDALAAKLELVLRRRPAVVAFAFGLPPQDDLRRLRAAGIAVWATVESGEQARAAVAAGADVLIAQGAEAGGHRGGFSDGGDAPPTPLLELIPAVAGAGLPVVAAGGIADAGDVRTARDAGASAVQIGTALLLTPEAGTSAVHRTAVAGDGPTVLTRVFSGRRARAIENAWTRELGAIAPRAYPEVHHLTSPLRAAGRATGDPDLVHLWAGVRHAAARAVPAAEVVRSLAAGFD